MEECFQSANLSFSLKKRKKLISGAKKGLRESGSFSDPLLIDMESDKKQNPKI